MEVDAGKIVSREKIEDRVRDVMSEEDPDKRLAKARRLRSEVWDMLDPEDRKKLAGYGLGPGALKGPLRGID